MPIIETQHITHGQIGIWELTETVEELLQQVVLTEDEQERLQNMKVERRQKEFLAARALLQNLLDCEQKIIYNPSGKPALEDSELQISITHSANLVALFISAQNIGIDAEQTDRNISKVIKRFLHQSELQFLQEQADQQKTAILLWSAKEAIFKCATEQGIQFNEQIIIAPFQPEKDHTFDGTLHQNGKQYHFVLHHFSVKGNVVVYCVEETT